MQGNGDNGGRRRPGSDDESSRSPTGRTAGHDAGDDGLRPVSEDSESDEDDDRGHGRRHGKKKPHGRQNRLKHVGRAGESPGKIGEKML